MIRLVIEFDPEAQQVTIKGAVPPPIAAFVLAKAQLALTQQPLAPDATLPPIAIPNGALSKRLLEGRG